MDGCFGYRELKALQALIAPPNDETEPESDDLPQAGARRLGPGDVGPGVGPARVGPHATLKTKDDEIWHPSEVAEHSEPSDPRLVPEYEMKFKQAVTPEDVFLGMGFKTPGTASCEWLTVLVKLPGESLDKLDLSVESESIDVRSPRYRLHLATPHPVEPNASSAKWHQQTATLEVTLRLTRELDDVNF